MGVPHRRFNVSMAESFLEITDVAPAIQLMGGIAMAQNMRSRQAIESEHFGGF